MFCAAGFTQAAVDINDRFYSHARTWELRGVTSQLPQLRPYPLGVIQRVLDDAIANGTESDAETAKEEYERIFSKPYGFYATGTGDVKLSLEDGTGGADSSLTKNLRGEIGAGGDIRLHPLVSLGYKFGIYGQSADFEDFSPAYTNILEDSIFDPVSTGPFELFLNWNTNITVGTQSVYGSAGMSRVGFGPFYGEGLALNDTGYHSANITFNATQKKWSYASVYEAIGATRNIPDIESDWLNGGKYLAFHALKWHAFKKFHVTYYENIIFGPNMNISYLFPAPYYAVQNIGGANDNLQMGLLLEIKPVKGLNCAVDFFADDMELNEILKFNFDTKLRFGLQAGIVYAPENPNIPLISFSYTAVMPYVYAHWEYDDSNSGIISGRAWNYQNYTNSGINIGSALDPNSDKFSLNFQVQPTRALALNFSAGFTRHANSAEDFSDDEAAEYMLAERGTYSTDGSASMGQMFSGGDGSVHGEHVPSAWEKLGFMTSDHKMYVCQAGISAEYTFARTKFGQLSLKAGYTFEYIRNAGVGKSIYKGGLIGSGITKEENGTYTITETGIEETGKTYDSWSELKKSGYVQQKVREARQDWIDSLHDSMNHYLSLSVKYSY